MPSKKPKAAMSQKAVDELIRTTIGPKRSVEALFKSSTSPRWARYAMYGLDRGVVYVNLDRGTARVLAEDSHCAKQWARRQARAAKLAEVKIAKAAKEANERPRHRSLSPRCAVSELQAAEVRVRARGRIALR